MLKTLRNAFDSRFVFRVYATLAGVGGGTVVLAGIRGIPYPDATLGPVTSGRASLAYTAGMVVVAMAMAAVGFARVDDPDVRRRALYLLAIGHVLIGLIVLMQWSQFWRDHVSHAYATVPLVAGIALLACAGAASYAHAYPARDGPQRIRSHYDEQIRQAARIEERTRLARDLHDAVKQQLFVIQTGAATAQARFDADRDGAREAIEQVRAAAREATTEMEALLDELQARPLENVGLVESVRTQAAALQARTGAEVFVHVGELPPSTQLPHGAQDAIYRVAQEALANIGRHARASEVSVSLRQTEYDVELRISDNGQGFDPSRVSGGMGQRNMRARAGEVGGTLRVASRPGDGTTIVFRVPQRGHDVWSYLRHASLFLVFLFYLGIQAVVRGELPTPLIGHAVLVVVVGLISLASLRHADRAARRRRDS
jgi:signal transduction histidine kinase